MTEQWRDVPGYEGLYEVSDHGRIYSHHVDRIRSTTRQWNGRYRLSLRKDGKRKHWLVHVLVGLAFVPNPEGKPELNHKDGDPANNVASNLEWVTRSENMLHAHRNDLHIASRKALKRTHCGKGHPLQTNEFGVPQRCRKCKYLVRRAWTARNPEKERKWKRESQRRWREKRKAG